LKPRSVLLFDILKIESRSLLNRGYIGLVAYRSLQFVSVPECKIG